MLGRTVMVNYSKYFFEQIGFLDFKLLDFRNFEFQILEFWNFRILEFRFRISDFDRILDFGRILSSVRSVGRTADVI